MLSPRTSRAVDAFFLILLASISCNAQAAAYQITQLGPMDGVSSGPWDLNNARQVVGIIRNADGHRAFLWQNGSIQDLGTLGGTVSSAWGINDAGQVVGRAATGPDPTFQNAFLWQSGNMQDLGSLGGGGSLATSINNLGHIVGQSDNNRAFLWIKGAMQELDTLEGGGAMANGINDAGQIAGWSTVESGLQHAALWKNGAVQDLGTLGGTLSWAEGINNSGVVAGSSRNVNERWRAFTWQNGTMQDLGTFNDGHSYANAINDKGQVVGQADGKAFLWANGVMYDLCALAECTTAGWEYFWDATAINEAGDIVGYGRINGESQGYLLTVVPPPPVDLSGTIKTTNGTDICAMVLASGQYTFSCNPPGVFSLTGLPRRSDGTVKRQIYAHGFFPKIDTLPDSTNEDVVMTRSGICPNYNLPYDPAFVPGSAGKEIYIAGEVLLQNTQTSICAMVLANGQYMFSCDGTGSYFLKIPLDNNGQFKLQVYADGFAPSIRTFDEFKTTNIVRMARAVECQ